MFKIKFPTKRIFWIFPILRINGMVPFCNLFTERPLYYSYIEFCYQFVCVNDSFSAFLSIFRVFLCHPVLDRCSQVQLQLCPFLTILALLYQKKTSYNNPNYIAAEPIAS